MDVMSSVTGENEITADAMEVDEGTVTTVEPPGENEEVDGSRKNIAEQLRKVSPHLPISKLKKIARSDPEYILTSSSAFVAAAFATELFVQSITEEMLALSHLSSKNVNGKNTRLTYESMSECVSRKENYQFLEDVIPKTKNLRNLVKQNRVRYAATAEGQSTLPFGNDKPFAENAGESFNEERDRDDAEEDAGDEDADGSDEYDAENDSEEKEDGEVLAQLREIEELNRVQDIDEDQDQGQQGEDHSDGDN
ncbi:hypothetical protein HG535_0C05040 [Zygotorulaspora mrakii]|uniref:Transcription factor CBF/NF-Y/archaeal histone domain-containing protein n=1 Tax=Zygotorulaspora mrakii TaxID=42260 RepID=A0A7H9B0K3_ZYGMR|nr:uncharacterized protein HG535_0C05040 [Zygotorulaspora mrakii]QLG72150.1 hypothetical protein HG535_0C05040 [Zygotorulaspora mrakii]